MSDYVLIEWCPDLYVGNSEIDSQHKKLVDMINNLFESIMKGSGNKNLDILFKELHEYVSSHFAAEESLMKLFFPSHEAYAHHGQNSEIRKTLQGRGAGNGHRNVELFV